MFTQNSPRIFPISSHKFKAYCLITMNIYSFLHSTFFLFDTSIFTLEIKSLNNLNSPLNNIGVSKTEEREEEVWHYYINYKETQTNYLKPRPHISTDLPSHFGN